MYRTIMPISSPTLVSQNTSRAALPAVARAVSATQGALAIGVQLRAGACILVRVRAGLVVVGFTPGAAVRAGAGGFRLVVARAVGIRLHLLAASLPSPGSLILLLPVTLLSRARTPHDVRQITCL